VRAALSARGEQPSRAAPAHTALRPREQAHAAEAQPRAGGGAPAGNERHDAKK